MLYRENVVIRYLKKLKHWDLMTRTGLLMEKIHNGINNGLLLFDMHEYNNSGHWFDNQNKIEHELSAFVLKDEKVLQKGTT